MLHEIQEGMLSNKPDDPKRREVHYYDRPADQGHLFPPAGYDVDVVAAKNASRSDGWEVANKKDEQAPKTVHAGAERKKKKNTLDEGWVSDDEGHPEESRITPCTFAFWATGCKPAKRLRAVKYRPTKLRVPKVREPILNLLSSPALVFTPLFALLCLPEISPYPAPAVFDIIVMRRIHLRMTELTLVCAPSPQTLEAQAEQGYRYRNAAVRQQQHRRRRLGRKPQN